MAGQNLEAPSVRHEHPYVTICCWPWFLNFGGFELASAFSWG